MKRRRERWRFVGRINGMYHFEHEHTPMRWSTRVVDVDKFWGRR